MNIESVLQKLVKIMTLQDVVKGKVYNNNYKNSGNVRKKII